MQTNFGGSLQIDGVRIGDALAGRSSLEQSSGADGSCMVIVGTDAPLDSRNLQRLAKRASGGWRGQVLRVPTAAAITPSRTAPPFR